MTGAINRVKRFLKMLLKERIIKEVGKIFVPQLGQRKNWMLKSLQYNKLATQSVSIIVENGILSYSTSNSINDMVCT